MKIFGDSISGNCLKVKWTADFLGLGYSWGGFESLAIPCDPQLRLRSYPSTYAGPLIRLHVGLEDPRDLITELEHALDAYRTAV